MKKLHRRHGPFLVYVYTDAAGSWPVIWRGKQPPQDSATRTFRFVAEVEDRSEAELLLQRLRRELEEEWERTRRG